MRLHELFKPGEVHRDVKWEFEHSNALGGATYSVDVKDGSKIMEYGLNFATGFVSGIFEISFVKLYADRSDGTMEITGTGREFAVFSGMAEATRDFVSRTPGCLALYFTAKEQSRIRTYRTMARRMAGELGWELNPSLAAMHAGDDELTGFMPFMLVKPGMAEQVGKNILFAHDGAY